ncbi:MAG: ParA family protein [Dysgonamonadaceae bacterium]|jgi:cellulose biosynthesis protein BcsQ|nr:ParA family protein [Dysgonamonadaceae bacterium]
MKKESKYVAFSTQKGGAGKTTLTVLVASYLHYVKGYNVAVVDCDYPQCSIVEMRERDLKAVMEDEHYKLMAYEQFTAIGRKAYPVVSSTPETAVEVASELSQTGEFDYIFFDLPGTVNNPDVIRTLSQMDYIFSPISADRVVMESTLRFAVVLNQQLVTTGKAKIKGLYLLWNLVDGREKTELYDVYEEVIENLQLQVLKTFLPDSKRFRREQSSTHKALFRSTLFPADKTLVKGSNLDALTDEILELIK